MKTDALTADQQRMRAMSKPCDHDTLVRAKTGGWYCISRTGCEFTIPEPAPLASKDESPGNEPAPLPCPFCGGTDLRAHMTWVGCMTCGASGPGPNWEPKLAWNRRAVETGEDSVIADVREILAEFNSEDVRVMARRAVERLRDCEISLGAFGADSEYWLKYGKASETPREPFKPNVHFYRLQHKTDKGHWQDFDASLWDFYAVPLPVNGSPPQLCPHGFVLADNVCGPCSEGRPNRPADTRPAPRCSLNGNACRRQVGHSGPCIPVDRG